MFPKRKYKQKELTKKPKFKIKAGDRVLIVRGKDGPKIENGKKVYKSGKIVRILYKEHRVIVEGINMVKRHTKGGTPQQQEGGIIEKPAPIHISNVMLEDPSTKKPTRVGHKLNDKQKKVRYAKQSGKVI